MKRYPLDCLVEGWETKEEVFGEFTFCWGWVVWETIVSKGGFVVVLGIEESSSFGRVAGVVLSERGFAVIRGFVLFCVLEAEEGETFSS